MNKYQKNPDEMNLLERLSGPTPKFFKKLRTLGLILAAAGGVLVAAPIALPAALVTAGGYLITAGAVATAISQAAVEDNGAKKKE
jgi:multisubunit Na+/H+ antiporter MnhG subunit